MSGLNLNLSVSDKAYRSGVAAVLFFLVSLPQWYAKTNNYLNVAGECPSFKSKLLHTLAFFVLAWLAMKYVSKIEASNEQLARYALYGSLLFFFVSSDEVYMLSRSLNAGLADERGCPTMTGVAVHTVVFWLALMGCN